MTGPTNGCIKVRFIPWLAVFSLGLGPFWDGFSSLEPSALLGR